MGCSRRRCGGCDENIEVVDFDRPALLELSKNDVSWKERWPNLAKSGSAKCYGVGTRSRVFSCAAQEDIPQGNSVSTSSIETAEQEKKEIVRVISLCLPGNSLGGSFPYEAIGKLRQLLILDLSSNQFRGKLIEAMPVGLPVLEKFNVSNNFFTGAVPTFNEFPRLREIRLAKNRFTGRVPPMQALHALELLDLHSNKVNSFSPELAALPSLRVLRLGDNCIDDPLNHQILLPCPSLAQLELFSNQIPGSILPSFFYNLPKLRYLDLCRNKLVGDIPVNAIAASSGAGTHCVLEVLILNSNNFLAPCQQGAQLQHLLPSCRVLVDSS